MPAMMDWAESVMSDGSVRSSGPNSRAWQNAGLAFIVAALLWLLGFVAGFTPWLGYRDYDFRSGVVDTSSDSGVGTSAMLLMQGQTAYIDYEVDGDPGEAIYLDVAPWPAIKFSERMRVATAGQSGRAEFPIAETGLYRFKITPTPSSYRDTLRYEVSWGAK